MTNYRSEYEYCKRLGIEYFEQACDEYQKLQDTQGAVSKWASMDWEGCSDALFTLREWKYWMDQGLTEDEIELYSAIKFGFDENQYVFEPDFRLPYVEGVTHRLDDLTDFDSGWKVKEPTTVPSTYDNIGKSLHIQLIDDIEQMKMDLLHKYIGPERASEIIKLHNDYQKQKEETERAEYLKNKPEETVEDAKKRRYVL